MALDHSKPALACPSLYSTIRLAHLVQHIRDRLKSFIKKQDGPKRSAPFAHGPRQSIYAAKAAVKYVGDFSVAMLIMPTDSLKQYGTWS